MAESTRLWYQAYSKEKCTPDSDYLAAGVRIVFVLAGLLRSHFADGRCAYLLAVRQPQDDIFVPFERGRPRQERVDRTKESIVSPLEVLRVTVRVLPTCALATRHH